MTDKYNFYANCDTIMRELNTVPQISSFNPLVHNLNILRIGLWGFINKLVVQFRGIWYRWMN